MPYGRECPKCRTAYYRGEEFCPLDGTALKERPEPPDAVDNAIGRLVAGRFVLQEFLGGGSMGVVYRATHKVLERSCAVKLLRREFVGDERALARFFREARVASAVDHSNIVRIYDYGQTELGEPYLVMEYVEGTTLFATLIDSPARSLPLGRAVDILLQVARALQHAHERRVVHRDIKPENILLADHDGQPDFVKVLDFGLAKVLGQPALSVAGEVMGTPEFIAPEALSGAEVGGPADLYALGIMLHDTIAGSPPFSGTLREVLEQHLKQVPPLLSQRRADLGAGVPRELDQLVARLCAKDPQRRPDAAETVLKLEQIRALLPPRSLSSLLLAQTMILPEGREPLSRAQTMILPQRNPEPTLARPIAPTLVPKSPGSAGDRLREIDAAEANLWRLSERLAEQTEALGRKLWPAGRPAEAEALHRQIAGCEAAELELGTQTALRQEQLEQERQRLRSAQHTLRLQMLELSERSQHTPLVEAERQTLQRALLERERAFFTMASEDTDRTQSLRAALEQARRQMRALQGEVHSARARLAQHLLQAPCPVEIGELRLERQRLEQVLGQFRDASAVLDLLLQPPA